MIMKKLVVFLFIFFPVIVYCQKYTELYLDSIFQGSPGTFILYDLQNKSYQVYNPNLAKKEFPVHSTSKILWSVIGLEENLISSDTDIVKWDSVKYSPKAWWPDDFKQDQTIITALKNSVNWYYIELFESMTPEMVEKYLDKTNYQKGYHVEKLHYFGLTYTIKKSALEQIDFLKSLYLNEFNLSAKALTTLKKGMLYSNNPDCKVYMKTGTGQLTDDSGIGWLIGWVEKGENTYVFAFNIEDEEVFKAGELRTEYSQRVLKGLGLMN